MNIITQIKSVFIILLIIVFANEAFTQCYNVSGNNWNQSWESCQISDNPNSARTASHWVHFEFVIPESITDSWIWNANLSGQSDNGIKDVLIDYSTDGTTWTELGPYTFLKANEQSDYQGVQGPDFGGVFIKEILFTVVSTYGDGTCASISEVQFNIDPNACYGVMDECGVCNGEGKTIWYLDADQDGLGSALNSIESCNQPDGYVDNMDDYCDNGTLGWAEAALIFSDNGCLACHGSPELGGLRLDSYDRYLQGGNTCGSAITTGSTLSNIINISGYDGCGTALQAPSMNQRVGGAISNDELALLQNWINAGTPQDCNCAEYTNIALTGTASMNSAYSSVLDASNINDNNIVDAALAHTEGLSANDWMEIDLGSIQDITDVVIWNRIDCCPERLNNVYVLSSINPFMSNTDINTSLAIADFNEQLGDVSNESTVTVHVNQQARYIRLQKSGNNPGGDWLNVYEIQVFQDSNVMDTDADGLCDTADSCPGFDNNLIGTSCDDGNVCTVDDIWTSQCDCEGRPKRDTDNDGICDDLDVEPSNPCTADGTIDGTEPPGFIINISNDCDGDAVTLLQGDQNDFDACINATGLSLTVTCQCPNSYLIAGGVVTSTEVIREDAVPVTNPQNAEGLANLLSTGVMSVYNPITLSYPYMDVNTEICFSLGYANMQSSAGAVIELNYYTYTFKSADFTVPAYTPQEICIKTTVAGPQMARISAIHVDGTIVYGSYYKYCECSESDPTYINSGTGISCTAGTPCDDGNDCTITDVYNCGCECAGTPKQDIATKYLIDVGPEDSNLWPAAYHLSPATNNSYFTWVNPDGLLGVDKGVGNDLNRDAIYANKPNTFEAVVTNGLWKVLINFASHEMPYDGIQLKAENEVALSGIDIPANSNSENFMFNTRIYDGKLSLEFSAQGGVNNGWGISRIILTKVDQPVENCVAGDTCDDGDGLTVDDKYNCYCNCVGVLPVDSDTDGVYDANDFCPGFDDNLIGTVCDDGNDCTIDDRYTSNCKCEGTPTADYAFNEGNGSIIVPQYVAANTAGLSIACPGDQSIGSGPDGEVVLPDFTADLNLVEHCIPGVSLEPAAVWTFDDYLGYEALDRVASAKGVWQASSPPTWTIGQIGGAVDMDGGANDKFLINVDPLAGTSAVSIGGWMRLDAPVTQYEGIFGSRNTVDNSNQWAINVNANGDLDCRIIGQANISGSLTVGQWHHVVMTWDNSGAVKIYFDGVQTVNHTNGPTSYISNGQWLIGDDPCCSGREPNAKLDDFAMFAGALTQEDVEMIYSEGLAGRSILNIVPPHPLTPLVVSQFPASGSLVNETTSVTIIATDGVGNDDECSFEVTIEDACIDYSIQMDNSQVVNSKRVRFGIESNAVIVAGSTIDFDAGEYILLQPGFEVTATAVFHAFIDGCN